MKCAYISVKVVLGGILFVWFLVHHRNAFKIQIRHLLDTVLIEVFISMSKSVPISAFWGRYYLINLMIMIYTYTFWAL